MAEGLRHTAQVTAVERAQFTRDSFETLEEELLEQAEVPIAVVAYSATSQTMGLRLNPAWTPEVMDEVIKFLRAALNEMSGEIASTQRQAGSSGGQ